jgi:hypothetical protein
VEPSQPRLRRIAPGPVKRTRPRLPVSAWPRPHTCVNVGAASRGLPPSRRPDPRIALDARPAVADTALSRNRRRGTERLPFEVFRRSTVVGEPGSLVGLSWVRRETTRLHSISDLSARRIGAMDRPSLTGSRERRGSGAPGIICVPTTRWCAREAIAYTWRQWVHLAAVLGGSGIAWPKAEQWAMPLACILLALTAPLAIHNRQREARTSLRDRVDSRRRRRPVGLGVPYRNRAGVPRPARAHLARPDIRSSAGRERAQDSAATP